MTAVRSSQVTLFLMLMLGAAFSQYTTQPQWRDVEHANNLIASSLNSSYDEAFATDSLVGVLFPPYDLTISYSVRAIGLTSMVDGSVCPRDGLSLLIARGSLLDRFTAADVDNDTCTEYENQTIIDYSGVGVDISFRGINGSFPLSTEIQIPDDILSAMRDSSGSDNLSVFIHGNVKVAYQFDNPTRSGLDCTDNFYFVNGSIPISQNFTFKTYGSNHLFFLRAPVLSEQWFRNNKFDVVVLSQDPLSSASVQLNGVPIGNSTMVWFGNATGPYGLLQLKTFNQSVANLTNTTNPANSTNLTNSTNQSLPVPLQWSESVSNRSVIPSALESQSHPFVFVYEFDTAYAGLGANNLSLMVGDICGGSGSYNGSVLSRMLSYNGNSLENGSPIDANISRGSVPFNYDVLNRTEISFGLVAVILLLAFINFWALK
jgi:hypothetical protein